MNYYLYYDRVNVAYYLESADWHERFTSGLHVFAWLNHHMGPGDTLHWVGDD